jgi:hypothetical protein
MRRFILGTLATLLAASAIAQTTPPGRPFETQPLALGTQFDTLFNSCGTPINPTCPRLLPALERPLQIHYIAAGGRSADVCSASVYVQRQTAQGTATYLLLRLVFGPDTADNVVLPLPRAVRLEPGDVIGVGHAQGTCAIHATVGVEYLD